VKLVEFCELSLIEVNGQFKKMDERLPRNLLKTLLEQTLKTLKLTPSHPKITAIQSRWDYLMKKRKKQNRKRKVIGTTAITNFFKPTKKAKPPRSSVQPRILRQPVPRNQAPPPLYHPKPRTRNYAAVPQQIVKVWSQTKGTKRARPRPASDRYRPTGAAKRFRRPTISDISEKYGVPNATLTRKPKKPDSEAEKKAMIERKQRRRQ